MWPWLKLIRPEIVSFLTKNGPMCGLLGTHCLAWAIYGCGSKPFKYTQNRGQVDVHPRKYGMIGNRYDNMNYIIWGTYHIVISTYIIHIYYPHILSTYIIHIYYPHILSTYITIYTILSTPIPISLYSATGSSIPPSICTCRRLDPPRLRWYL